MQLFFSVVVGFTTVVVAGCAVDFVAGDAADVVMLIFRLEDFDILIKRVYNSSTVYYRQ